MVPHDLANPVHGSVDEAVVERRPALLLVGEKVNSFSIVFRLAQVLTTDELVDRDGQLAIRTELTNEVRRTIILPLAEASVMIEGELVEQGPDLRRLTGTELALRPQGRQKVSAPVDDVPGGVVIGHSHVRINLIAFSLADVEARREVDLHQRLEVRDLTLAEGTQPGELVVERSTRQQSRNVFFPATPEGAIRDVEFHVEHRSTRFILTRVLDPEGSSQSVGSVIKVEAGHRDHTRQLGFFGNQHTVSIGPMQDRAL